jgi:nitrile hydratase
VAFDGTELWGADATPGLRVSIDAWQPYLDFA